MQGPLRGNRDFRLLWIGQALSAVGSRVTAIALPLLVLALTGSPAKAGVIGFVQTVPFLLFFLPAGALVDRLDRKKMMLLSDVIRAIALGSLFIAVVVDRPTLFHIALVGLTEGTFFVLFDLSEGAALPLVVPKEQLSTAIAQNQARLQGADLAGQPLGGFLFGVARYLPFLFDTLSYVISFFLVFLVRSELQEQREPEATRLRDAVMEGVRWVWNQSFLKAIVVLIAGTNFAFNALFLVLIVRARELGASPAQIGVLLAFNGVGALVGAGLAPRIQRGVQTRFIVLGCMWGWFATLAVMVFLTSIPALAAVVFLSAVGSPIFNVATSAYTYALVPDRLQGRVRSVVRLVAWSTIPFGSLSAGLMAEELGAKGALTAIAALSFVVAVASTATRAIRHAPSIEDLLAEK